MQTNETSYKLEQILRLTKWRHVNGLLHMRQRIIPILTGTSFH
jgi:hypothetical protein